MNYVAYDNCFLQDGIGAQMQRILSIYLISRKLNLKYIHSSVFVDPKWIHSSLFSGRNFSAACNRKFNNLLILPSDSISNGVKTIKINSLNDIDVLTKEYDSEVMFLIAMAHPYIDKNPDILNDFFPIKHDFVSEKINKKIIVAIHIRRGDVQIDNRLKRRFVPLEFYIKSMENLAIILNGIDYEFHIHSEGNIKNEIDEKSLTKLYKNIFFHIDEDPVQSFVDLVNADILVAGFSSFCYSASFLRRKGIVLYPKFWHSYPSKHILIDPPELIIQNKERILKSISDRDY
jgi:hypothetical protein